MKDTKKWRQILRRRRYAHFLDKVTSPDVVVERLQRALHSLNLHRRAATVTKKKWTFPRSWSAVMSASGRKKNIRATNSERRKRSTSSGSGNQPYWTITFRRRIASALSKFDFPLAGPFSERLIYLRSTCIRSFVFPRRSLVPNQQPQQQHQLQQQHQHQQQQQKEEEQQQQQQTASGTTTVICFHCVGWQFYLQVSLVDYRRQQSCDVAMQGLHSADIESQGSSSVALWLCFVGLPFPFKSRPKELWTGPSA